MKLLSNQEIEQIAADFGVASEGQTLSDIRYNVLHRLPDIFRSERENLPHKGFFHNKGNLDKFVEYLQAKVRESVESVYKFAHENCVWVKFTDFSTLEVYDEQIRMNHIWDELGIGLHSGFYDVIIQFLFDKDGAIQQSYQKYKSLDDTLDHYSRLFSGVVNEMSIKKALANEKQFGNLYEAYQKMTEEMQVVSRYLQVSKWEECLRNYGIDPSLKVVKDVKHAIEGKSAEKAKRYSKRYTEAQQVLIGAKKHGLLDKAELKEIRSWEELFPELTNDAVLNKKREDYLNALKRSYDIAIKECDISGTRYMQKKKSKMLADMEVCKQVKELCGADCFIDRSMHKNTVYHVNFVLDENQVLVFRIGKETPSVDTCMRYAMMSIAIDSISKQLSKTINLQNYSAGMINTGSKWSDDTEEKITKIGALVKDGAVEKSKSHLTIYLPMGSIGCKIVLKKKEADEQLKQISPFIHDYLAAYGNGNGIDMKGVFIEREPHL